MVLKLHCGKQWLCCGVKDTVLEHATEEIIRKLHQRKCFIYFVCTIKALTILPCPCLPLLYTPDQILTVHVGLAAQYVSHYHESDILCSSREGGKTPGDLVFRVPCQCDASGSRSNHTSSSSHTRQHLTASSILTSCHRAENSYEGLALQP